MQILYSSIFLFSVVQRMYFYTITERSILYLPFVTSVLLCQKVLLCSNSEFKPCMLNALRARPRDDEQNFRLTNGKTMNYYVGKHRDKRKNKLKLI